MRKGAARACHRIHRANASPPVRPLVGAEQLTPRNKGEVEIRSVRLKPAGFRGKGLGTRGLWTCVFATGHSRIQPQGRAEEWDHEASQGLDLLEGLGLGPS